MHLSRLVLNMGSPMVRRDLADVHEMHRTMMAAFPDVPAGAVRATLGVLWRLETERRTGSPTLIVQSGVAPDWKHLPSGYAEEMPEVKAIDAVLERIAEGDCLRFRLLANATRKIDTKSGPGEQRRNGRRVLLRSDGERLEWIVRHGVAAGFLIGSGLEPPGVAVDIRPAAALSGWRPTGGGSPGRARISFDGVLFEGMLTVVDAAAVRRAIAFGIGPGKSYGFGLLSVAPNRLGPVRRA